MAVFEGGWWAHTAGFPTWAISIHSPKASNTAATRDNALDKKDSWCCFCIPRGMASFYLFCFFIPSQSFEKCWGTETARLETAFQQLPNIAKLYLAGSCDHPPACGAWAVQQEHVAPAARTSPTACHNSAWNATEQRAAVLNTWMWKQKSFLCVFRPQENICIAFLS